MGLFVKGKEASKAHDFIKEFNAIERVTDGPVAHPQDARSTLSLSLIDCFHWAYANVG